MNVNELAKQVFEENKARGWWDDMNRDIHQTLMLVVTEIAEATEGVRKDLMDDHLPHRKMEEVELADTLIRLLDLAGRYGWQFKGGYASVPSLLKFYSSGDMPPAVQHFALVDEVVWLAKCCRFNRPDWNAPEVDASYTRLIRGLFYISKLRGYDLEGATMEKLEYNRQRADHKRENRALVGGKKF